MQNKIKLKHLDVIIADQVDYAFLMTDVLGYSNSIYRKARNFYTNFKSIHDLVEEISSIQHDSVIINESSPIKYPAKIGHLSYVAYLELTDSVARNIVEEDSMSSHISHIVAIACYEENKFSRYDSTSKSFLNFKEQLMNQPLLDMIGLYNSVLQKLTADNKLWSKRFFDIEVTDKDAEDGGRGELARFNVITTLTGICNDFNVPEEDAWHISYSLVQENSYRKAYEYKIQDNVREIKEAQILANQKKHR